MIKLTFQTKEDYIKFTQTAILFTHLRAYNAGCHLWKKEDLEDIKTLDDDYKDRTLRNDNPELFRKCVDTYDRAKKEYGDDMDYWKSIFDPYPVSTLLYSLGFNYNNDEDGDGVSCVMDDFNVDVSKLNTNEEFPTSFPVVCCIESGHEHDGLHVVQVYPDDFKQNTALPDYSWLEENIRNFWTKGEGHYWGR